MYSKKIIYTIIYILCLIFSQINFAANLPIEIYNIKQNKSTLSHYLYNNDLTLILPAEIQKKHFQRFLQHVFATNSEGLSPWSAVFIKKITPKIIEEFKQSVPINLNKEHYAFNFHNHSKSWCSELNKQIKNAKINFQYHKNNRAIAVRNTYARKLPTLDPDYLSFEIAGQGYPFDNFQESAIYIGTPLYVLATSANGSWSYVITPDAYTAWVLSSDIAYASRDFIEKWNKNINSSLIAVTKNQVIINDLKNNYLEKIYIGTVLPYEKIQDKNYLIKIPTKDNNNFAAIKLARLDIKNGRKMPLLYNLKNISYILRANIGRPYGWGGLYFYNDCSQELKSFFTPFGIWLPRNSEAQIQQDTKIYDYSELSVHDRLANLRKYATPWLSIINIKGHVMLYIGQYYDKNIIMTYQNIWAYHDKNEKIRYVIGKSTILPLNDTNNFDIDISSQASKKYFRWTNLQELL